MLTDLRRALLALALLSVITGITYPLVVTGIATFLFPRQADGSLLRRGGTVVGSTLVGQSFTTARYLWGRPSALATPYDAGTSGGSNLGPTNPRLDSLVRARIAHLRAGPDGVTGAIPVDLVTASASGLDPHVSPAAALVQVPRIARARQLPVAVIRQLIERRIEGPVLGVLGAARVNVLRINLALDSLSAAQEHP